MSHRNIMNIDKEGLKELKRAYEKAEKEGEAIFTFRDTDLFIIYAEYLIEYLETKFE